MFLAVAGLVISLITRPAPQSPEELSKPILLKWAQGVEWERVAEQLSPSADWTTTHEMQFERVNDGPEGALNRLKSFLEGKDLPLRRAASQVVCSIRPGMQHAQWLAFRSKELQIAASYVLDRDPETARNATDSFIQLCGGYWDRWDEVQPLWIKSLDTARPPQTRMLVKLFAFTTVPMKGALPGLNKLFHSIDVQTANYATFAIGRASIHEPDETQEYILLPCASECTTTRRQCFKDFERLVPALWGNADLFGVSQPGFEFGMQRSWIQATVTLRTVSLLTDTTRRARHVKLFHILESGLNCGDSSIQISCAKALVTLGQEVENDNSSGASMVGREADTVDVGRLRRVAADVVRSKDPQLAKTLVPDSKGGHRVRIVF